MFGWHFDLWAPLAVRDVLQELGYGRHPHGRQGAGGLFEGLPGDVGPRGCAELGRQGATVQPWDLLELQTPGAWPDHPPAGGGVRPEQNHIEHGIFAA